MYERCPVCGLKFEREPGYFLGAMYIGYGLGIGALAALSALAWFTLHWPLMKSVAAGTVLFLPLTPVLTWMARVLWIYLDQTVDPKLSFAGGLAVHQSQQRQIPDLPSALLAAAIQSAVGVLRTPGGRRLWKV